MIEGEIVQGERVLMRRLYLSHSLDEISAMLLYYVEAELLNQEPGLAVRVKFVPYRAS